MRISAAAADISLTLALALVASLVVACGAGDAPIERAVEARPRLPWSATSMPPPPVAPSSPEQIALGAMLFHDPILSSDRKVACVTCHSQYWGMSDGLPQSIGVGGAGPSGSGRVGPTHTRRNAPTLWNAAYRPRLFWDGRASSLEEQALGPMNDAIELGRAPDEVAIELRALDGYRALFASAFPADPAPIRSETIRHAIAAFVRTMVSDDAPYDRYARGDDAAMSSEELRGMALFAEAGCAGCHAPPLFEQDLYVDIGLAGDDVGRGGVTGLPADQRAMRVPTLRNLRESGPYFHDGSATTIEGAVGFMASGRLSRRRLSADEIALVATFLRKSLVDRKREPERPLRVPSGLPVPVDGFRVWR